MKDFYAKNRKEWRKWFRGNHRQENKVRLIYYKKHTDKPSLTTSDAMDEAICWGWIDTIIKRLDEERYCVTYVKRTKKSKWSDATFARAEREIKAKRITKVGMQAYQWGKKNPVHDHGIPKNPTTPDYLKTALEKNKTASENFKKLAPSYKRMYLRWLLSAKRQETREKRVREIVERMKKGKKLFQ